MSLTQLELIQLHAQYKTVEKQLIEETQKMYYHPEEEGKEEHRAEMARLAEERDSLKEQYVAGGGDAGQLEVDVS